MRTGGGSYGIKEKCPDKVTALIVSPFTVENKTHALDLLAYDFLSLGCTEKQLVTIGNNYMHCLKLLTWSTMFQSESILQSLKSFWDLSLAYHSA